MAPDMADGQGLEVEAAVSWNGDKLPFLYTSYLKLSVNEKGRRWTTN